MDADRVSAIRRLLEETLAAHGEYETTELGGVYDEEWPRWYAAYLLEHGVGQHIPGENELDAERLSARLAQLHLAYTREQPEGDWPIYYAERLGALEP
jgi:hypothetical protein